MSKNDLRVTVMISASITGARLQMPRGDFAREVEITLLAFAWLSLPSEWCVGLVRRLA